MQATRNSRVAARQALNGNGLAALCKAITAAHAALIAEFPKMTQGYAWDLAADAVTMAVHTHCKHIAAEKTA